MCMIHMHVDIVYIKIEKNYKYFIDMQHAMFFKVVSCTQANLAMLRPGGWAPRSLADFGDGGAFPEIHMAQRQAQIQLRLAHHKII